MFDLSKLSTEKLITDMMHWFHTDEQIQFLDDWIRRKEKEWT